MNPFDSKDKHLAPIINHIKAKFVLTPTARHIVGETYLHPHSRRHEIDQPSDEDYYFGWPDGVPQLVHLDEDHS